MRTISLCISSCDSISLYLMLFCFIVLESHVLRFIEFLRTLVKASTVIGVIVAVTAAVLLVVGCVLVTQNG